MIRVHAATPAIILCLFACSLSSAKADDVEVEMRLRKVLHDKIGVELDQAEANDAKGKYELQYSLRARELLNQVGADFTPLGKDRYLLSSWVRHNSPKVLSNAVQVELNERTNTITVRGTADDIAYIDTIFERYQREHFVKLDH